MQAAKGAEQASPIQIRLNNQWWPSIETHRPAFVASSKCSHFVNLLMFLFVLAGLMHKKPKLLGISLETLAKYIWEKKWSQNKLLRPINLVKHLFMGFWKSGLLTNYYTSYYFWHQDEEGRNFPISLLPCCCLLASQSRLLIIIVAFVSSFIHHHSLCLT